MAHALQAWFVLGPFVSNTLHVVQKSAWVSIYTLKYQSGSQLANDKPEHF